MPTPVWLTGFERYPATLTTNGGGLADAVVGTISVQTTTKRTGTYAFRANPSPAASSYMAKNVSGSPTTMVGVLYFRIAAWPSGTAKIQLFRCYSSATAFTIYLDYPTRTLHGEIGSTSGGLTAAISLDTWYRVDFKAVCTASATLDIQLDGTAATQATSTITATSFTDFRFGSISSVTIDIFYDDIEISVTSGDYPIGATAVEGLYASADGTHNAGTNVIEAQDGTDIGTTTAYNKVDSAPIGNTTTYIKQVAVGTGNYAEVVFPDTAGSTIHGGRGLLCYTSSATQANQGGFGFIDEDTTYREIWGNPTTRADYSDGSTSNLFYRSAQITAPTGGWDAAAVNALKARMGYSNDISPVPYWIDILLEIAYQGAPPNIAINLAKADVTAVGQTLADVVPGEKSTLLNTGSTTAAGLILTVVVTIPPTIIILGVAPLSTTGQAPDVVPGLATTLINVALLVSQGQTADLVPGLATTLLDPALLTPSGLTISITPISLRADGARDFNGTTDRIDWSSIATLTLQPITISAWIYSEWTSGLDIIFGVHASGDTSNVIRFYINADNGIGFIKSGSIESLIRTGTLSGETFTGKWRHVLVTHDGVFNSYAGIKLYVDGTDVSDTLGSPGSGEIASSGSWSVGGRISDDLVNFEGKIGEVAVWNRVLAAGEIAYLTQKSPLESGTNVCDGLIFCVHPDEPKDLVTDGSGTLDGTTLVYGPDLILGSCVSLDTATLQLSGRTLEIIEGVATISLDTANLLSTGLSLEVIEGLATTVLDNAVINTVGQIVTVSAGAIPPTTIVLDQATTAAAGHTVSVTPISLRTNGARNFNGSTDRIDWSSISDLIGKPMTVSAWIKIDTFKANQYIITTHNSGDTAWGRVFNIIQSDTVYHLNFVFNRTSQTSIGSNTDIASLTGRWVHVLVTYNGLGFLYTDLQFYIDGSATGTHTELAGSGTENNQQGSWSIGGRIYSDDRNIDGSIGEVAVWDRVLTSDEITYLAQMSPLESGTNICEGLLFCVHPDEPKDLVTDATGTLDGTTLLYGPDLILNECIHLSTATVTTQGEILSLVEGEATIPLDQAVVSSEGLTISVIPGAVVILIDTAATTALGLSATVSAPAPGATTISLDSALVALVGPPLDVVPGTYSIILDIASLTSTGLTIDVVPGSTTLTLETSSLSSVGRILNIIPGVFTASLDNALIAASGRTLSVVAPSAGYTVLDTALITASGLSSSILTGAVSVTLSSSAINLTGQPADVVPGVFTLVLSRALQSLSGLTLSVLSAAVVPLDAASISTDNLTLSLIPGSAVLVLDPGTLQIPGLSITISTITSTSLQLAQLSGVGNLMGVVPGSVTLLLDDSQLALVGQVLLAFAGDLILLDPAQVLMMGQDFSVVPGSILTQLDTSLIGLLAREAFLDVEHLLIIFGEVVLLMSLLGDVTLTSSYVGDVRVTELIEGEVIL